MKLAPVPSRKMIILAAVCSQNCPFVVVLREMRKVTRLFYSCFLLVIATHTQKMYIKKKKVKVVFFLDMNDVNSAFRATEKYEIMLKLSISLQCFSLN